ncbi:MAG: STAS domain-containing protein [Phycisphaerae bacterium]|nr:STAS domain-containing protein [Phycisphaerae bacterium]
MATDALYATKRVDGVLVIIFRQSQMLNAVVIDQVSTGLKDLVEKAEENRFVVDFSRVNYLSSSALGMLIGLQRRVMQKKGQMKLSGISTEIMEVFRITKLDTVFDIYKEAAAAVEAFRSNL